MNKIIEDYLSQLKKEMSGSDKATIQDAVADAHEHLFTALDTLQANDPSISEEDALKTIIAEYGTPEEIAAAYQQAETYLQPYRTPERKLDGSGGIARFFGIFVDPAAWGSFVYMVIALITGTLYFSWVIAGAATALSFSLFLFGVPLAVLFLVSVQGLGLMEGRLVEGLLGVRMPRRPLFFPREDGWFDRLKLYLNDKRTWLTLLYLIMQLPFGVLYITVWSVGVGISASFFAAPILQEVLGLPVINLGTQSYFLPVKSYPFAMLLGIILLTAFMHLSKWIGKIHGWYAKRLLVVE